MKETRIKEHSRHLLSSFASFAGQQVEHWQPEQNYNSTGDNDNNESINNNSIITNNDDNTNDKN